MSENKSKPATITVDDFIAAVEPEQKREDARTLLDIFHRVTGCKPKMWGPSIIGFGQYHYTYDSGREGDFLATGFSPRKAKLVLYIMPGYADYGPILDRLGKWSMGKSCLYINKLTDIDLDVLEELIRAGLRDLEKKYPVKLA